MKKVMMMLAVSGSGCRSDEPGRPRRTHTHHTRDDRPDRQGPSFDVKGADGKVVSFTLNDETKVLRGKAAAKVDGLKKGERVAVESAEKDGTLFAASVKVGGEPTAQAYVCPMHPEVTSKEPGALPEVQDVPGSRADKEQ